MYAQEATHCCAVHEFEGLNDDYFLPKRAMKTILMDYWDENRESEDPTCLMYFLAQKWYHHISKEEGTTNLVALEEYVKKHELGSIVRVGEGINPNTGNYVLAAFFIPDPEVALKFASEVLMIDTHYHGDHY